jgi:hypothetical protein
MDRVELNFDYSDSLSKSIIVIKFNLNSSEYSNFVRTQVGRTLAEYLIDYSAWLELGGDHSTALSAQLSRVWIANHPHTPPIGMGGWGNPSPPSVRWDI